MAPPKVVSSYRIEAVVTQIDSIEDSYNGKVQEVVTKERARVALSGSTPDQARERIAAALQVSF